jgi:hypothetical protein
MKSEYPLWFIKVSFMSSLFCVALGAGLLALTTYYFFGGIFVCGGVFGCVLNGEFIRGASKRE